MGSEDFLQRGRGGKIPGPPFLTWLGCIFLAIQAILLFFNYPAISILVFFAILGLVFLALLLRITYSVFIGAPYRLMELLGVLFAAGVATSLVLFLTRNEMDFPEGKFEFRILVSIISVACTISIG